MVSQTEGSRTVRLFCRVATHSARHRQLIVEGLGGSKIDTRTALGFFATNQASEKICLLPRSCSPPGW